MGLDSAHPETLAVHGGSWRADPATGAVAVPIYQSTSFQLESTARAERLFALDEAGHTYSRLSNPTQEALETRLAALEGGAACLVVASGQAASALALLNLAEVGDNVVASTALYGGSWNLLAVTLKRFGIEARLVDPAEPASFGRATDARTKAYYAETLPNPGLNVFPLGEVAAIGRAHGVPLIVDNTAAPLTARPFAHGAAVVVYSATKYIGGHGTTLGGAVIDGGTFPWAEHGQRFPQLTAPDPGYRGRSWLDLARPLGLPAYALRLRRTLLCDLGAAITPFAAFQLLQGLETLPLRIAQHNRNAIEAARFLHAHPAVATVIFPGLQTGIAGRRAAAYLKGGFGALVGFELKGGRAAGQRFIEALELFYHAANIGDARSLAIHPSTTTHAQLSPEEQRAAGVTPGYIRLSIGIEHPADILADLGQALDRSG